MSIDIPAAIEPDIVQYAQSERITASEAIVRLIQAGLDARAAEESRIQALLGDPMNEHDAAVIDEVVEMAMNARKDRWEPRTGA
jgi:hypothetical protein